MLAPAALPLRNVPSNRQYEPFAKLRRGDREKADKVGKIRCILIGLQCKTITQERALYLISLV